MRIMAVSMIRNDADIVASFLGHCGALFDRVFAVDHYSSDGTAEMLAAATRKMPLTLRTFRQRDKRQGDILTALAREAFADGADWVVPLDADEFPEVADRAALEAMFHRAGDHPVARLRWRNAHPMVPGRFDRFEASGRYEVAARAASYTKVALRRNLLAEMPNFALSHGSHGIMQDDRMADIAHPEVGHLRHIPFRSKERFEAKIAQGILTADLRTQKPEGESSHYREIQRLFASVGPTPSVLRRIALHYGEADALTGGEPSAIEGDWAPCAAPLNLPSGATSAAEISAVEKTLNWEPEPLFPKSDLIADLGLRDVTLRRDWRRAIVAFGKNLLR